MDLELAGKHALVCGGSRGMGRAIAKALVAEGAMVALAARDSDDLRVHPAAWWSRDPCGPVYGRRA